MPLCPPRLGAKRARGIVEFLSGDCGTRVGHALDRTAVPAKTSKGWRVGLYAPPAGRLLLMSLDDVQMNVPGPPMDAERLLSSAEGYAAVADAALVGAGNQQLSSSGMVALYFLLAQALELAVKAWLVMEKVPLAALRRKPYGHDLESVLSEAKARGFSVDSELSPSALQALNRLYSGQKLMQYPTVDGFSFPNRQAMRGMVDSCIRAASVKIRGRAGLTNPGASISYGANW